MLVIGDEFAFPGESERQWGSYLRFSFSKDRVHRIERAPLTGIPLYWTRWCGGLLCFSHPELIDGLPIDLAVDWDFVRHSLAYRNFRTERTGIRGISELLPGVALTAGENGPVTAPFWLPWSVAAAAADVSMEEAAARVEDITLGCVDRWSEGPDNVLLELSGGLDSSIVAMSLAACGRPFTGVTAVTATADGDERRYARDVARQSSMKLVEAQVDEAAIDLLAAPARLTARPAAAAILAGFDRAIAATATALGKAQLWSGIGGDNVFGFSHSVSPAIDAWRAKGLRAPLFQLLGDIAAVASTTRWHAARALARRLRPGTSRPPWPRDDIFANRAALPSQPFLHPWHEQAARFPPGKRQHVEALLRIADFVDRPDRWHDRRVVAPLLSQPLVETCLAIPSWLWVEGGRDRAVARAAFARRLPASVLYRRTKGRLEAMCASTFLRERKRLAPYLLDGRIAAQGLLDRGAIERYFARGGIDSEFAYFRLIEIADLERWVRSVEAVSHGAASSSAQFAY
ncbi:asparagine synthase-related protein [Sphingopyxis terrae]|uniref:asparagine synthase (glutamine-hydrolyzing) n=2 Tax=Sphingopyxis terrae TaxID=33052 RepID=A0A1Y6FNU1_9SPHN|nr:asparagine synthase C-terminal domain-containing protein [Sphingopyxis terrae]SMQ76605.1 asparagine synthase (glutamine-hydrolysing) [Sphingopyxis terrae subsp. ummariensis]